MADAPVPTTFERRMRRRTVNPYTGDDPRSMFESDRQLNLNYADAFGDQYGEEEARRLGLEEGYRGQADEAYGGELGYTPEEAEGITQEGMIRGGMASPQDLQGQYLDDYEQGQVTGDPFGAIGQDYLETLDREGAQRQREQLGQGRGETESALRGGEESVRGAIQRGATGARGAFQDRVGTTRSVLGAGAGNIREAVGGLESGLEGSVDQLRSDYDEAIDPSKLEFTEADADSLRAQAGRTAQLGRAGQIEDIERRAAASGNVNPMALAAYREEQLRSGNVDAANAVSDANLRARQAQIESQRDISGRRMQAAERGGQMAFDAARVGQGARVGAETGLTNLATDVYDRLGREGTELERGLGSEEASAEMGLGGRRTQATQGLMQAGIGTEANIAENTSGTGRFISGANQSAERERARRGAQLAFNRQDVAGRNIDTRFGQGLQAGTQIGRGRATVAQGRLEGGRERRGYLAGQAGYQGNQAGGYADRRTQAVRGFVGGAQQGSQGAAGYDIQRRNSPGIFGKIGQIAGTVQQIGGMASGAGIPGARRRF